MDLEFKKKQSVLTKYHIDPNNKKPVTTPVTEKQQVHPLKNLIQMVGEAKKNKKIKIINRDMIQVDRPEKITKSSQYYVDYEQNLIHFHPDVAGQTVEYKYDDMGVTVISANKIFTKQDNHGNVVELLEDIIESGRDAIDVMITIGGVAVIMKRLEDDIEEGYEVCEEIQANIQQAKDEVLNVRGNKEVIIRASDWVANIDVYEKEITHDLNSENLHITAKSSDTKEGVTIGYKILSKSKVLLKSDEAINMSVILSASYYHATQTVSDNIAEEVIKARKGETGLDVKITKIDENLINTNNKMLELDDEVSKLEESVEEDFTAYRQEVNNKINGLKDEVKTNIERLKDETYYKIDSLYYVRNCRELINALNTAKTKPSKIYILNDIELTDIAFIPSNTIIEGIGTPKITSNGSLNLYFSNFTANNPTGYNGTSNIIIKNLIFDGQNRTSALTMCGFAHMKNLKIENCYFKDLHVWHMLELNACSNVIVNNCKFENYGNVGSAHTEAIQLDSMISNQQFPWFGAYDGLGNQNIKISNCLFENIGNKAIGGHSFAKNSFQTDIMIYNNMFLNVHTCMNINDFTNLQISNNSARSIGSFFVSTCEQNACAFLIIDSNFVQGPGHQATDRGDVRFVAINPSGSLKNLGYSNVTITNNIIKDFPSHAIGMTANYVSVCNNKFLYVNKNAIYAYGGKMITITNNVMSNCAMENNSRYGIAIGNNPQLLTNRVIVDSNHIENFRGISIFGSSNNVVVANNIIPNINNTLSTGVLISNNATIS